MATKFIIEADSAAELSEAFDQLRSEFGGEAEGGGEPGEAPKTVRGRKKTAAAPVTPASGAQASTEPSSTGAGSSTGPTATTAASPSDLLGAGGAAAPTQAAGGVSKDTVVAKMQEAMAAAGALAVQEALVANEIPKRISLMDPSQYGSAVEVFETLIATS